MADVDLYAEGYTGSNAKHLGVFELQEQEVQERPTYKKRGAEQYLYYTPRGSWMVGDNTSKASGWWKATSGARTPGDITEPWQTPDDSGWVDVGAARIVQRTVFEAAAVKAARALGDVVLHVDNYAGKHADKLGVFELQAEVVHGRPTYKRRGAEEFLYYDKHCDWSVGDDTSKSDCFWTAASSGMTPGDITETWQVAGGGTTWVRVPGVTLMTLGAFEKDTMEVALAEGDIVLYAPTYVGPRFSYLGVYRLQPETWRQGRPTYKKEGLEGHWSPQFLFYGPRNVSVNWSGWQLGEDLDTNIATWVSTLSLAKTPSGIVAGSPTSDVDGMRETITAQGTAVHRAKKVREEAKEPRAADIAQRVLDLQLAKYMALDVKFKEATAIWQWKIPNGPGVPDVQTLLRTSFEEDSRAAAALFGNVALRADTWVNGSGEVFTETMLGVFERMGDLRNGRPMYKRPEKEEYLYYTEGGQWVVGTRPGVEHSPLHWWYVTSGAITPDAIGEKWSCFVKKQPDPKDSWEIVADAQIVKADEFTQAVLSRSGTVAHVTIPGEDTVLYDRQPEVVHGRPTYKKRESDERLKYTVERQEDDEKGRPVYANYWALGDRWRVKSFALTPFGVTETWEERGWRKSVQLVRIEHEPRTYEMHDVPEVAAVAPVAAPDTNVNWVAAIWQIVLSAPFAPDAGWRKSTDNPTMVVYEHVERPPRMHFTLHAEDPEFGKEPASHFRRETKRVEGHDVPGKILALLLPWTVLGKRKTFSLYWVSKSVEPVLTRIGIIGGGLYVPHGMTNLANADIEADVFEQTAILSFVRAIKTAALHPVNREKSFEALQGMLDLRTTLPGLKF